MSYRNLRIAHPLKPTLTKSRFLMLSGCPQVIYVYESHFPGHERPALALTLLYPPGYRNIYRHLLSTLLSLASEIELSTAIIALHHRILLISFSDNLPLTLLQQYSAFLSNLPY